METKRVLIIDGGRLPGISSMAKALNNPRVFEELPLRSQKFLRDLGETPESFRRGQERDQAAKYKRERRIMRNIRNEARQGNEPEGLELRGREWFATCRSCRNDYAIYCMPQEFDPDMSYCGGSEWCCP